MWLITASKLIYISFWPLTPCWKLASFFTVCTVFVLARHQNLSPHVCVSDRRVTGRRQPLEVTGRGWHLPKSEGTTLLGWAFLSVGDNVWLSRVTHLWAEWPLHGKRRMEFSGTCAGRCLGPELMGAGRVHFSEDQRVNSASHGSDWATERMEEKKRC